MIEPGWEYGVDNDYDDYDIEEEQGDYITCYPGTEPTYSDPWVDPELEPFRILESGTLHYIFPEVFVHINTEKETMEIYHEEYLVAVFQKKSAFIIERGNSLPFVTLNTPGMIVELRFDAKDAAVECVNAACRLGVI